MARAERKALIERIEEMRGTRVITYVTGERPPFGAQIGTDAVRPLYDHLRELGHIESLDLLIISRGGDIDIPWRIANAFRATADKWNLLVPFCANSAATLLALGADEIVMGPQAELGPIDPTMSFLRQVGDSQIEDKVSVEDVMSYVRFLNERAVLTEQGALAASVAKLTDRMDAVSIGRAFRTHTHIREVARLMLGSRSEPASDEATANIVTTLAEKVYAHGHAIGRREATDLELPVVEASPDLDAVMWDLLTEYEDLLKVNDPVDPMEKIRGADEWRDETSLAAIESAWGLHEYQGTIEVKGKRQMPQNLAVNVNVQMNAPAAANPGNKQALQQAFQKMLDEVQQGLVGAAQQAVNDALKTQAPLTGAEWALRGAKWTRVT